jgi:hypothetical protein
MAANHLDAVSVAERHLVRAFAAGQVADVRDGTDDGPQDAASWGPERQVRAEVIAGIIGISQAGAWNSAGLGEAVAYALIISRWILVTALVAGVTRVLNRTQGPVVTGMRRGGA